MTFSFPSEYFSPRDTLSCGQVFRYERAEGGFFLYSADKACFLRESDGDVCVTCEDGDEEYFRDYFDLGTDYAAICAQAESLGYPVLTAAAKAGKGIRIVRQDPSECLLSFIVSQQNNIPRIKGILFRLCAALGERKTFAGREFHAFPSLAALAEKDVGFYREQGLGYRAGYVAATAKRLYAEGLSRLDGLKGPALKKSLTAYPGVGNKVADCVSLFAFHDTAAFPVDTWIAKLYREDFGGRETDREKINSFFTRSFGENAGIFQQYLFYYKRENKGGESRTADKALF